MALFIDCHALQTVPPSNINRDDTGAPKSALFGGVQRHRVSSQAWKRAIRKDFGTYLTADQLGTRTKRVVSKVVEEIIAFGGTETWSESRAAEAAEAAFSAVGLKVAKPKAKKAKDGQEEAGADPSTEMAETGYLLFLSTQQIKKLAQAIVNSDGAKLDKKKAKELLDNEHSIDIAMFGRMVADAPDYNVDAAVQVAHAIGVSGSEPEFDYFTAVDDEVERAEETGAGMIGTVQMMSSTLYRYATVNLDGLTKNLGHGEAAVDAAVAFVQSFIRSMPSGKQNTFANNTLPEVVVVSLREDRPVSWVNAFEEPVPADVVRGRRREAARKLAAEATSLDRMYDTAPRRIWVLSLAELADSLAELGDATTRSAMLDALKDELQGTQP